MTSGTLQELKRIIQTAYEERQDIRNQLTEAGVEAATASAQYKSWERGILFKHLFPKSFQARAAMVEVTSARVAELKEQLHLTAIGTTLEMAKEQAEAYFRMRDQFAALSECTAIWDIKTEQATDKFRERTTANRRVDRQRVKFSLDECDLIQWDQPVPHLGNANGGDLFLYPGFILYRAARTAFSVIDFHDTALVAKQVRFQEDEGVPTDSTVVGSTWAKANKDGSPDRRFAGNHQIPIALYGQLVLQSESGLHEEFQFSNPQRVEAFVKAWELFTTSFQKRSANDVVSYCSPPLRYFVCINDQVAGPYSAEDLAALNTAGTISADSLCCPAGMEENAQQWIAYRSVSQ